MDNYQKDVAIHKSNLDPAAPRFCRICGKEIHINEKFEYIRTKRKSDFLSTKPVYLETGTINAISNSLTNIEKEEKYDQV